jgi:pilus assembly protein Flp/PilA
MKDALLKLSVKVQSLMMREEGQDLVEYALVVGLISVAAVAGLGNVATAIKAVFTSISGSLTSAA